MTATQLDIPTGELQYLLNNLDKLSESDKSFLQSVMKQRERGCRTNRWIDLVRPNLHPKQRIFLGLEHREVMFGGAAGGGKGARHLTSDSYLSKIGVSLTDYAKIRELKQMEGQVLTPKGFCPISEVFVGQQICGPDGTNSEILQIHDRGEQEFYRLTFIDGATCEVDSSHLWPVAMAGIRKNRKKPIGDIPDGMDEKDEWIVRYAQRYKLYTTEDLYRRFKAEESKPDEDRSYWPMIPLPRACLMTFPIGRTRMLPHYVMGVLLGDGGMSSSSGTNWSKPEPQIADEVDREFIKHETPFKVSRHADGETFGIVMTDVGTEPCQRYLKAVNLDGCRAWEKFIPRQYLMSTVENRWDLAQGLMDTDGYVDDRGHTYYSTTSPQLAKDVQWLMRSLGFTATISDKPEPKYVYNGEVKIGRHVYDIYIKGAFCKKLLRLERKKNRCRDCHGVEEHDIEPGNRLIAMEPIGRFPSRCITVSHPCGLYLTNDFIVTHNSDAMLLAAMQYVDVPGYSAILFRKSLPDLNKAGAIMDRCKTWLMGTDARWSERELAWFFPTGKKTAPARLAFGHIDIDKDKFKYLGAEYQFIGFDEVVQHPYSVYSYLFSRLRRLEGSFVPLRVRSATNPGGVHGEWVKERFIPKLYIDSDKETQNSRVWTNETECEDCGGTGKKSPEDTECIYCDGVGHRTCYFVPSRIEDNPSLDRAGYLKSLVNMTHVERYRMEHGDWSVTESGNLFKHEWARYYSRSGDHFVLHRPDGLPNLLIEYSSLIFFITADTATKEKTNSDFTCIASWAYHPRTGALILLHVLMAKMEVPKIATAIINQSAIFKSQFVMIESSTCAIGVIQELRGSKGNGIAIQDYNPVNRGDKVARSTTAQIMMENGQIYFPGGLPAWLDGPMAQLVGFPAAAHDDFVDCVSMAAHYVHSRHQTNMSAQPTIIKRVGT